MKEIDEMINKLVIEGKIKVTDGSKPKDRFHLLVHDFWRLLYVSVYFYLVPFSTVIISCS